MILKRFVCALTACFFLFSPKAEAYLSSLSPENFNALYNLASRGQVSAMNNAVSRGLNIDATNPNGDTGLCVAAKKRNKTAYKSFLQSGANPSHPCTWEISGYQNFARSVIENPVKNLDTAAVAKYSKPGMSFTTKALIGVGVVAAVAGTAIALSGGGGGGGSGSDKKTNPDCVHGTMSDGICTCSTGYSGEKCDTCASGYGNYGTKQCYKTLACEHGHQKGGACVCNVGYTAALCNDCATGYGKDSTGLCVKKQNQSIIGNNTINSNYNETENLSISNTEYADVYGLFYDADQTPHNYLLSSDKMANDYSKLSAVEVQTTVADYKYDNQNHILWYSSSGVLKGYLDGSIAYNNKGEVVGHAEDDVIYDDDGNALGEALKLGTQDITQKYLLLNKNASINIENQSDGRVYGLYSSNADTIYNNYVITDENGIVVDTLSNKGAGISMSTININNNGDGSVFGILGNSNIYSGDFDESKAQEYSSALMISDITITNQGNGSAYGIYNGSSDGAIYHLTKRGNYFALFSTTTVTNTNGFGNTYGLYSAGKLENSGTVNSTADAGNAYGLYTKGGSITNVKDANETVATESVIAKSTTGSAYGAYVEDGEITNGRIISAKTTAGDGNAYGIYLEQTKDGTAKLTNTSGVIVQSAGGNAYGIYNKGGEVTNSTQRYEINVTSNSGYAYGIYSDGGSVTNSGRIFVTGPSKDKTYGIFATNNATVTNTGFFQFRINNDELNWDDDYTCTSSGCLTPNGEHAIYLEKGAKLVNAGTIASTSSLNLGSRGVQITNGGNFTASSLEGNLSVASDVVSSGFNSTYTLSNAINAQNTENLSLSSESAMFNADLKGSDVVLTKKNFDKIVSNSSLASFLEENYTAFNNEALFNTLKQKTSTKELNETLKTLSGQNIVSRISSEDLIMQKELDFNISNKMFENKEASFAFSGNLSPQISTKERSQTRYALSGKKIGNTDFGVALSLSDMHTDNGRRSDARTSKNFELQMPVKTKKNAFQFLFNPKLAYAYGTYERDGYTGKSYDGKIEKRMAGISSQIRYPLTFGGFTLEPTTELNVSVYQTKLKEDQKQFSLSAKRQQTYSAELGFGAYLSKEKQFSKTNSLSFMTGAMLYHEFSDPYDLKMSMNEMSGNFKIRNEEQNDNYLVLRSKLSYEIGDISIYGGFLSYINRNYHTKADLGFKYAF